MGTTRGRLQILATHWPITSPLSSGSTEEAEERIRRGLYHRLTSCLKSAKSTDSPLLYVQSTIQLWMHRHVSRGDFNCWDGRSEGVGYSAPLRDWAEAIGYCSRPSDPAHDPVVFITRPSSNLLEGTEMITSFTQAPP